MTDYKRLTDFLRFYNNLLLKVTGHPYVLNGEDFEAIKLKFQKSKK